MKKFQRFNKQTEVKEDFISCDGVINSITETPVENKGANKKAYHRFSATIDTPSGESHIGGQIYEGLIPFLGGLPKEGDKLQFAAKVDDLREGYNGRWGVAGNTLDEVSEDFLQAIADL